MALRLTVKGMGCEGCEETVEEALCDVEGVESASADRGSDTATVEGDADVNALVSAVEDAGYDAEA